MLGRFGESPQWQQIDQRTVQSWDVSLGEILPDCMLDRKALADAVVSKEGFPKSASSIVLDQVIRRSPDLGIEPARSFTVAVIQTALQAAYDDKAYFETLTPYLWVSLGNALGDIKETNANIVHGISRLERDMADMLTRIRDESLFQQVASTGMSEKALRKIVEGLGGRGVPDEDLGDWLNSWTSSAKIEPKREKGEGGGELFPTPVRAEQPGGANPAAEQFEDKKPNPDFIKEIIDQELKAIDFVSAIEKLRVYCRCFGNEESVEFEKNYLEIIDYYVVRGRRLNDQLALAFALEANRNLIGERAWSRSEHGEIWATFQYRNARILAYLGDQRYNQGQLDEAISLFRQMLEIWDRNRSAVEWADVQNQLGSVLVVKGERERGSETLVKATRAHASALSVYDPAEMPYEWGCTQDYLGIAYRILSSRQECQHNLGLAVDAHRMALKTLTLEAYPESWALVQSNLGSTLFEMGIQQQSPAHLRDAEVAIRNAFTVWTRETHIANWASAMHNLGLTLRALGIYENCTEHIEEAEAVFLDLVSTWSKDESPYYWAVCMDSLALTLWTIGSRKGDVAKLNEALRMYHSVLNIYQDADDLDAVASVSETIQQVTRELEACIP